MNEKRHNDVSEKQSEKHASFSGVMIKLGAYSAYSIIFLIKKINHIIRGFFRAVASGIAALVRGFLNIFKNAGRILVSPFVSGMKKNRGRTREKNAKTDMTVKSIRTTDFRQFIVKAAHITLPAAALIAFAVILGNASEIDRHINERTTIDIDTIDPVPDEMLLPGMTEAAVTEPPVTEKPEETSVNTETEDENTVTSIGVYMDDVLIGCVSDVSEIMDILDSALDEIKSQEDVADAEYKNRIEYRKGYYSEDSLTEVSVILEKLGAGAEEVKYTVEEGDIPYWIAEDNGISLDELYKLNPEFEEGEDFETGTELVISVNRHTPPVIVTKEITEYTVIPYTTKFVDDDELAVGETLYVSYGEEGEGVNTVRVRYDGEREISRTVVSSDVVTEPVDETIAVGKYQYITEASPDSDDTVFEGNGMFMWPADGGKAGDKFDISRKHKGLDIDLSEGTEIYAADDGKVTAAGWNTDGYGYFIMIDHGNGYSTLYSQLSRVFAVKGEDVSRGSLIGLSGSTGSTEKSHLHFEIRLKNVCKNPADYIRISKVSSDDEDTEEDEYYYDDYDDEDYYYD